MVAFMIQPVDDECCVDPCTRSGPCEPCVTTTTTTTTTLAPTTTTTTSTSTTSTTPTPGCPDASFVVAGASPDYNGTYANAGTYGVNTYYTNANNKHLWQDGATIPSATWVISDDPVGSGAVYTADTMGGSCPDDVTWASAGITVS